MNISSYIFFLANLFIRKEFFFSDEIKVLENYIYMDCYSYKIASTINEDEKLGAEPSLMRAVQ